MKSSIKYKIILFTSYLLVTQLYGQEAPIDNTSPLDSANSTTDKNSLFPLPVVYYTPESGLFFGVSLLYNFYIDREKPINASQIQLAAGYTTKDQLLIFLPFQLYWNKNKWRSTGELGFYNYAYPFYGIGNNNEQDVSTTYRALFPRLRVFYLKEVKPNLYAGARYWFENYDIIKWEDNGNFIQSEIEGATDNRTSGIGPALIYDTRDGIYYPTKGHYLESYIELNNTYTGSTHNYGAISFDYAYYYPLFDKTVIAGNAFSLSNFGTVPFNRLAQLGGNKKMRGYFQGFFQDKKLLLGQLEIRQELFWRFGVVAFGSVGQVAEKFDEFGMDRWNYAGGAGLRFRFDMKKKINVRLDYAVGNNSSGFYISFNEAF